MKQIRNGHLLEDLIDRGDGYFHWLERKSGLSGPLASMPADTEFVSVDGLDDILKEKAKEETREQYAETILEGDERDDKVVETIYKSIRGDCCLFEVIFCLANSINEMFEDLDAYDGVEHFFRLLMKNAGFDLYDEEDLDTIGDQVKDYWQRCIDRILERKYDEEGRPYSLFPVSDRWDNPAVTYLDRRGTSLWQQMNDWVDQHTNEDGEWVD